MRSLPLACFALGCVLGCAPTTGIPGRDAGGGPPPGTDGGPMTMTGTDAGPPPPGVDAGFDECAAETTMARTTFRPVDVIWVIDRSGSMRGEADAVQANINRFVMDIEAAMIDVHVVMVSAMAFVNVPGPLGTDPSQFLYVEEDVQSHDGLSALVNRFDAYRDFLRPDATTHFVAVTDDESDMSASTFQSQMAALLGHPYTLHAIASPPGSTHCEPPGFCFVNVDGCSGPDDDAADNGDQYWAVAMATGGQRLSICTTDWSGLFSTLTAAIAVRSELPCRYLLPTPPDGMALDRMRINVVYTPSGGTEQYIPFVGNFSACSASGGWYYEDDDIVVCPTTCDTLVADDGGTVQIALGCATVLI
ncbi:MAG: VWA domain-containing protein [Sandaracinaceae bacterium]|nr:VWA domain-containing protein [Sandaracinaceae bacterium]